MAEPVWHEEGEMVEVDGEWFIAGQVTPSPRGGAQQALTAVARLLNEDDAREEATDG